MGGVGSLGIWEDATFLEIDDWERERDTWETNYDDTNY
jgi:hypothetical protein